METLQSIIASLEPHHWVLVILCLIGLAFCACIIIGLRRAQDPLACISRRRDDKPDWIQGTAFAIAVLGLFTWMNIRDVRIADQAIAEQQRIQSGYLPADRANLHIDINANCGPRIDGMTDQIIITIATESDLHDRITGCKRIGQRMFQVKPSNIVKG